MLKFKLWKCKCESVKIKGIYFTKDCKKCIKWYKNNVTRKVIMVTYD